MSFTTNKYLEKPAHGSNVDTWDVPLNDDFNIIDTAFGGVTPLNAGAGSLTLSLAQYRPLILSITGTLAGNITYTIPSGIGGQWIVRNAATGGSYTVTIASGGGGSYVIVDRNVSTTVYSDGTNIRYADNWVRPSLAAGSSTQIQYNTGGILDASANLVYSGGKLGVGTASPTQALEVAGTVYSTSGGFKFPDGSVQTSAATGGPSSYVATINFGSTGLLPSTASSGAVVVAGTLNIASGGTGATSASVARTNLGAATAGSNSDITSINGLATALSVAQGGTGQTSYTNGQILIGNSATNSLTKATITGGTGITINNGNGTIEIVASGTSGVGTFSGGTTGLTPATPTAGAVVLGGTLAVANGGTGITSFGSGVGTALGQGVTGSGGIVLANSPTLVTPNLGTPSILTLYNAMGLPLASGVTGILPVANGGTGVTSSTGTGSVVLSASPTLTGTLNAAAITASGAVSAATVTSTGTMTTSDVLVMNSSFKRNRIINGNMVVNQRRAIATPVAATNGAYIVDRFATFKIGSGTYTFQQLATGPAGFSNCTLLTLSGNSTPGFSDSYNVAQLIEGYNVADLGWGTADAKSVTLSFWVNISVVGTYSVFITNLTSSYLKTFTVTAAGAWEKKTITIPGPTSGTWNTTNGTGMIVGIDLGSGGEKTGAASSWLSGFYQHVSGSNNWISGTVGATYYMTGFQLEVGSTATPYETQIYSDQLAQCQRYYWKTYNQGQYAGQAPSTATYRTRAYGGSTYAAFVAQFPTLMKTTPNVTLYNPTTGAVDSWRNVDSGTNVAANVSTVLDNAVAVESFAASDQTYMFQIVADAEIW
jgi:hypothetical protein